MNSSMVLNLSVVTLLVIGTLFVPAVGKAENPSYGGSLKVILPNEPKGLNPRINASASIDRIVYNNVYEGLVRLNRDGEIVSGLAKDWEISSDSLTYTFHLHRGVKFHNGDRFTSSDVEFTLRKNMESDRVVHPEYYRGIKSIECPDKYTVKVKLRKPNSLFLFNLARGDSVIISEDGPENLESRPVGTGPFEFLRWRRGSFVRLKKFDSYYREDLPYLDGVEFEFVSSPSAQIASLRAGDVDAIGYLTNPERASLLEKDGRFKVLDGVTSGEVILAMNNSRSPFDKRSVREAINYAIDREEIINGAMYGYGQPIGSHMSPANPSYIDLSWVYTYRPRKAEKLLERAGFPEGFKTTIKLPRPYKYSVRAGKIIADQLSRVGIDVEIELIGWGEWKEKVFSAADYSMTVIGHVEAFDISIYSNPDYYFRYSNERFKRIIERAESRTKESERSRFYAIAQWILATDVPVAFLFEAPSMPAMRTEVMGWWRNYPIPAVDLTEVWIKN